jgi:hypothetical protein
MLDISRFTKVLALAGSDKDGEALAALRKAQKMLRAANLSFTDVALSFEAKQHGNNDGEANRLRKCLADAESLLWAYRHQTMKLQTQLRVMESMPRNGNLKRTRAEIAKRMCSILNDTRLSSLSDRAIARRTGMSPQTVGNWRRRLAAKRAARGTVQNGRAPHQRPHDGA